MRKLSILSHLRAQEHNAAKPTDDDHGEAAADSDEDEAVPEFGQCVLFTNDEAVLEEEQKR